MKRIYTSRKFLLVVILIIMAAAGWIYALLYQPDQLATVCTFIIALLGTYGATNLGDKFIAKPPAGQPPADKEQDNG